MKKNKSHRQNSSKFKIYEHFWDLRNYHIIWLLASGINTHVMDHGKSVFRNSLEFRITACQINCLLL